MAFLPIRLRTLYRCSDGKEFAADGHLYRNDREAKAARKFYVHVISKFPHVGRLTSVNEHEAAIRELARMIDGAKSFSFDPDKPAGHYKCPRCDSANTNVVQADFMWCRDCRNETEPPDWIDALQKWFSSLSDEERRFFGILSSG